MLLIEVFFNMAINQRGIKFSESIVFWFGKSIKKAFKEIQNKSKIKHSTNIANLKNKVQKR